MVNIRQHRVFLFLRTIPVNFCIFLIRSYQLVLSPIFYGSCRFYPSCSQYCIEAIEQHGLVSGLFLSVKRLSRCHPWCAGGIDPVPETSPCKRKTRLYQSPDSHKSDQSE